MKNLRFLVAFARRNIFTTNDRDQSLDVVLNFQSVDKPLLQPIATRKTIEKYCGAVYFALQALLKTHWVVLAFILVFCKLHRK